MTDAAPPWMRASLGRLFSCVFRVEALILVALVATAFAIRFENQLTTRSMRVSAAQWGRTFSTYTYGDQDNGGTSTATENAPLDWGCTITRAYQYGYCGFGLIFDLKNEGRTLDLSQVDSLKIQLQYQGRAEFLRMAVKDHDPRFAGQDGSIVDKVNQTTITVMPGEQTVTLRLADFTVAEWWKDQTKATGEMARPSFGHIIAAEFITGADARPGEHRLRVDALTFTQKIISTEAWYSGIVAFWVVLIGWFLLQRRGHAERLRLELKQRLKTTLDTIPQMVWSQDEKGQIHSNDRWEQFTGVALSTATGSTLWDLIHPDDRQCALDEWDRCVATGDPFEFEYRLSHVSGVYRWVLARAMPAPGEHGSATAWFGTCTDVHDGVVAQKALVESIVGERRQAQQLKWASEHDELTSLPNRRAFQTRLAGAACRAIESGRQFGLLLLDMDHFKHTNDSFGHWAGDELLQRVAEGLKVVLREDDFVARIGGDEFAVILEPIGSEKDLRILGDKIFGRIRQPVQVAGRTMNPTASVGGAIFPRDADTANDLFKAADTALYALKRAGRGGIKLFHTAMLEEVEQAAAQLGRARRAISNRSLFPVYQPKVDLSTHAICGFEALLRWNHPTRGLQHPASLHEAFKDYELAAKIGEQVQRQVAADIRRWMDLGVAIGRVAINASPAEFLRDDYAERLGSILVEFNVPPEMMEIEVTEQAFFDRSRDQVSRALTRLRDIGMMISLDDFGTGYSSLSHLRDFPVDVLKIDQSFVQQMTTDPEIASIVAAVVNLARSLDISAVAEGVELPCQRDMLQMIGCQYAQGHLFSAAVEASAVPDLVPFLKAA